MTRTIRLLASIAILVTAAWLIHRVCYRRYACNIQTKRAENLLMRTYHANDQMVVRPTARRVVDDMSQCIPCAPDIAQHMIRAAALRMAAQPADAALDYRAALRIDRRSELFLNLGQAEMEAGQVEKAVDSWTTAAITNYEYIADYPEPVQSQVLSVVTPIYKILNERRATPAQMKALFDRVAREPK